MAEIDNILRLKNKAVESFISDRGVYEAEWSKWIAGLTELEESELPREITERIARNVLKEEAEKPEGIEIVVKAKTIIDKLPFVGIEEVFPSMFSGTYKYREYERDYKVYSIIKEVYREALEKEIAKVQEYL